MNNISVTVIYLDEDDNKEEHFSEYINDGDIHQIIATGLQTYDIKTNNYHMIPPHRILKIIKHEKV